MKRIKQIFDGEYGCEERTADEKAKVLVILEDETGQESSLSVDCEAVQCIYNDNRHCAAAKIGIAGDGASRAEQTLCTTFQMS